MRLVVGPSPYLGRIRAILRAHRPVLRLVCRFVVRCRGGKGADLGNNSAGSAARGRSTRPTASTPARRPAAASVLYPLSRRLGHPEMQRPDQRCELRLRQAEVDQRRPKSPVVGEAERLRRRARTGHLGDVRAGGKHHRDRLTEQGVPVDNKDARRGRAVSDWVLLRSGSRVSLPRTDRGLPQQRKTRQAITASAGFAVAPPTTMATS